MRVPLRKLDFPFTTLRWVFSFVVVLDLGTPPRPLSYGHSSTSLHKLFVLHSLRPSQLAILSIFLPSYYCIMVYLNSQQSYPMTSSQYQYQQHQHHYQQQQRPQQQQLHHRKSISHQLPMGDVDEDVVYQYRHQPVYKNKQSQYRSVTSVFSLHKVLLPLLYLTAMWNLTSSMKNKSRQRDVLASVISQVDLYRLQYAESSLLLEDITQKELDLNGKLKDLRSTNMKLRHEQRIKEEMEERVAAGLPAGRRGEGEGKNAVIHHVVHQHKRTAQTWIDQRQTALVEKIQTLQTYIQSQSREYVLAEYGPGPYRVEFQVKLPKKTTESKFVVELAPLDLMPHSLELFLDMVTQEAWDNTVFYHHVKHMHVLAAAPVNFGTYQRKDHHWKALGFTGLSFPEYSTEWPHEEYTLGFSGRGPNFYINGKDNSVSHGPGGQDRHKLTGDADPCFGKVVWGKQVIKDMMPMKSPPPSTTGNEKKDGGDEPQNWKNVEVTHIVRVKLQQPSSSSPSRPKTISVAQ